jgi:hypothetical protein
MPSARNQPDRELSAGPPNPRAETVKLIEQSEVAEVDPQGEDETRQGHQCGCLRQTREAKEATLVDGLRSAAATRLSSIARSLTATR